MTERQLCVSEWSTDRDNLTNNTLVYVQVEEQPKEKCITYMLLFLFCSNIRTDLATLETFFNLTAWCNHGICACWAQAKQVWHLFSSTFKLSDHCSDEQLYIFNLKCLKLGIPKSARVSRHIFTLTRCLKNVALMCERLHNGQTCQHSFTYKNNSKAAHRNARTCFVLTNFKLLLTDEKSWTLHTFKTHETSRKFIYHALCLQLDRNKVLYKPFDWLKEAESLFLLNQINLTIYGD